MLLHPATRLSMWLAFALFLPWLSPFALLSLGVILVVVLLRGPRSPFIRQLRRTRWLLLSIFLVYSLATPGVELIPALGAFSPTREGLQAGVTQAWRLAVLLAALSLLLAVTPGKELLAGLYTLLLPLTTLGLAVDRITARIWLTLYYAEQALHLEPREWRNKLQSSLETTPAETLHPIQFVALAPPTRDWAILAATLLLLTGLAL